MKTLTQPPLLYRMVANMGPLPKRGIEEVHKSIINSLRRYSAESIVHMALHMMWNPPKPQREEVRSAPWLTLLLVKWALQHNGINLRVGASIPLGEFDRLRQQLWELQGKAAGPMETPNVWLMLRTILYVQVEFQRKETWGFLRWPALYARLHPESTSRRQFREVMGMEPNVFIDLAYGLYSAVLSGNIPFGFDWLAPFRLTYGPAVDQMYDLFVRDLPGLRTALQADAAQRIRGKQELYEFPFLRHFPLLRLRDGRLHCWHPLVFARGLEDAVHLRLSQVGKDYIDSFSLVFEKYVTELAVGCGIVALDEAAYKAVTGGEASSVEVILKGEGCNIFVEAKMAFFQDDVLLQDSEKAIFQKTKRIRKAIKQGWDVGNKVREAESAFGKRFAEEQDFLLIVTNRDLIIGGGNGLQQLYGQEKFDYPNEQAKQRLPFANVFILSIEDFENTMGCVSSGEVNLTVLLKECALANQSGQTGRMFFSDFLSKYTKRWSQPLVLREARETAEARVFAALHGNDMKVGKQGTGSFNPTP